MKAIWDNEVFAESEETIVIENNHYFAPSSINKEFFKASGKHTICPWKGEASFYTLVVDSQQNEDACWYYPSPKEAAIQIKGYVAFWKGVKIS